MMRRNLSIFLFSVWGLLGSPSILAGQEIVSDETETVTAFEDDEDSEQDEGPEAPSPCVQPDFEYDEWIDRVRSAVYKTVCGSALWFDSFFGDEIAFEEANTSFGRLGGQVQWDEYNGLKLRGRFKAKLALPRFEKRVNAFVGRFDEDEFVADRPQSLPGLPSFFQQQTDQEWLAGFGYSPLRSTRSRLDFDVGVDLDTPIEPFVKARYRYNLFVDEQSLVRYRQTIFWRNQEGTGTTSVFDFERLLSLRFHSRWRTVATFSESTEGVDWRTTLTLYHYVGDSQALAYQIGIQGESDTAVDLREYGFEAIYRQKMKREWLFLELRGRVFWPRELPEESREKSVGISVGFEMLFGKPPS